MTPFTVYGLPILTALAIVLTMVSIRRETGLGLKATTESSQLLVSILGTVVVGFLVLSLVLAGDHSPVLLPLYALVTAVGLLLQRRWWPQRLAS